MSMMGVLSIASGGVDSMIDAMKGCAPASLPNSRNSHSRDAVRSSGLGGFDSLRRSTAANQNSSLPDSGTIANLRSAPHASKAFMWSDDRSLNGMVVIARQ